MGDQTTVEFFAPDASASGGASGADEPRGGGGGGANGTRLSPNAFSEDQLAYIRRRMLERGYRNYADLQRAMSVSHATISKLFSGERGLSKTTEKLLAEALGEPLPSTWLGTDVRGGAHGGNVAGTVAEVAGWRGVPALPVYRSGSTADLTLVGTPLAPPPWSEEFPPYALAPVLASGGFVLLVDDDAMAGRLPVPVLPGDRCWVAPVARRGFEPGSLVAVVVGGAADPADRGNIVRTVDVEAGNWVLYAEPSPGVRRPVVCEGITILGPVLRIQRELSPDGR